MNIKIKEYVIYDEKIPKELSGFRMALFSDSHDNFYGENAIQITEKIDEINPNIVLFAGDANCKVHASDNPDTGCDNVRDIFLNIAKKYETYYVTGNHEQRWKNLCVDKVSSKYNDYIADLERYGIHYLDNKSQEICNGKITITGLDLPLEYYTYNLGLLPVERVVDFVGEANKNSYNILLTHTPLFYISYAGWGADLTLCGHIHGGMIRLPIIGGVLSPYRRFFPKYDYGYFEDYNSKMIVSSGVGDHNIRFNLLNPCEIVSITIKSKE